MQHTTDEQLRRANRALMTVTRINQALVRTREETAFLQDLCRILVETGGYVFAWVGFAENDPGRSVRPVSWWGRNRLAAAVRRLLDAGTSQVGPGGHDQD